MNEKENIIDQISWMALNTICKKATSLENSRYFTVYCNKEVKALIDAEIFKVTNGVNYIKERNRIKHIAEKHGGVYSTNGLELSFEVDEDYNILTLVYDNSSLQEGKK